jgi:hypothetical protein
MAKCLVKVAMPPKPVSGGYYRDIKQMRIGRYFIGF